MPTCYAFGCNNKQSGKDKSSLSFHRFPWKRPALLKQWLSKLNRDVIPGKRAILCSEHFEANCFEEDLYGKYVGRSPGKRAQKNLKINAVPTIFKKCFEKPAVKERESSVRRRKAKEYNEASRTAVVAL